MKDIEITDADLSKKRLMLVALAPVLIVMAFASTGIRYHYERVVSAEAIADFSEMSSVLLELNRSLQKERSFSLWFGSEPGDANRNMLSAQKTTTDEILHELSLILEAQIPIHNYWGLREEFGVLIVGLQHLEQTRDAVLQHSIDPSEYYADINIEIHKIIRYQQVLTNDVELARRTDALATLLKLEESAWQEGDVVKEIVKQGSVDAYQYRLTNTLIASQESLLQSFFQSTPEHQLHQIRDRLAGPVLDEISQVRELILKYALDRSTREELLDGLNSLVSYRQVMYPFFLQETDQYRDHLLAIQRDEKELYERLTLMPELADDVRLVALQKFLTAANVAAENRENADVLTSVHDRINQQIDDLRDRDKPLAVPEWRSRSFERIKLFESLTLVAWHRMIDRTGELISGARDEFITYLGYSFFLLVGCLLFSYLMVARLLQTRQLSIQNRLLELEKHHNLELETRVGERTRDLAEATKKAELASQAKSKFLGNVSHHIRTPLNAILGFNQMLLADQSLDKIQQRRSQMVSENGNKLLQLVEDILLLVDLESGRQENNVASFEPRDFLERLCRKFEPATVAKGLALQLDGHQAVPAMVQGDVQKLEKVVGILLDNAIKFTTRGDIRVSADWSEDEQLVIAVEDSGSGIDQVRQAEVLAGFEQAQDGCDTGDGGLGIGLTIADKLVNLMRGRLMLCDGIGGGLRVEIQIPVEIIEAELCVKESIIEGTPNNDVVDLAAEQIVLTAEMNDSISQALDAADYLQLLELAEQVSSIDEVAGQRMKQMVESYNYDGLTEFVGGLQASA